MSIFNLMVEHLSIPQVGRVFHALSHDARRQMLAQLAGGESTVSDLAEPHSMSLAAASKHVKVLEDAGLLRRRIVGRQHLCTLDARPLAVAGEWLRFYEAFWPARLDALADIVESKKESK
ncbi:MAG: metalloregulator ArsR/SmtB family transcription factor [Devosia sp.]